ATGLLLTNPESGMANMDFNNILLAQSKQTVKGLSGGAIDSEGCGFIANNPSYEMNLESRIDYMRFTVEAAGGQPTLLVIGPNSGDSFCVLGDEISGLKPEISGVWESGFYQIYIGDRTKSQHEFVLDISTDN
ncbi:MAG: hypothetical protein AAFR77_09675, partial [Cyanobacteria bacterium J06631_2]